MRSPSLVIVVVLAACAGEDPPAPLEGTIAGIFDGAPFTPTHGAALLANGDGVGLRFSTSPIGCDTDRPPDGTIVATVVAELDATGAPVDAEITIILYQESGFRMFFDPLEVYDVGLALTAPDDATLAGTVVFATANREFALEGGFAVLDCR